MCGIAGILQFDDRCPDQEALARLSRALHHRGPDDSGTYVSGPIGLIHRRLSILDLSLLGHQPMCSGGGSEVLSYNGEIYNFAELRKDLIALGVTFKSTGDTEVLVEACRQWGVINAARRANGMFAFAYWDDVERKLWLVRDRMGIKPLFYSFHNNALYFASELKALVAVVESRTDKASLISLLSGTQLCDPTTPFEGIHSLEPGVVLSVRPDGARCQHRYFELEEEIDEELYASLDRLQEPEVIELFDDLLRGSVGLHLASDARLAATVSGGVDSSIIAFLTHRMQQGVAGYHANVIGKLSEVTWARKLCASSGMAIRIADVDEGRFLTGLPKATLANECPLTVHPNTAPFLAVCELAAADGVKVLLTGEGADELFGGYPMFRGYAIHRRVDAWKSALVRSLSAVGLRRLAQSLVGLTRFAGDRGIRSENEALLTKGKSAAFLTAGERAYSFVEDSYERASQVDMFCYLQSYLQAILWRNDRMGMAVGLESRVPFIENNLIRHAINLPMKYKLRGKTNKWILRAVAKRHLPPQLANRPKYGFPVETAALAKVPNTFFISGFLEQELGLQTREVDALKYKQPKMYQRCVLVELWGKLFVQGQTVDECSHSLVSRNVVKDPASLAFV